MTALLPAVAERAASTVSVVSADAQRTAELMNDVITTTDFAASIDERHLAWEARRCVEEVGEARGEDVPAHIQAMVVPLLLSWAEHERELAEAERQMEVNDAIEAGDMELDRFGDPYTLPYPRHYGI